MITIKHYMQETGYDAYEAESYTIRHYEDYSAVDGFFHNDVVAKFSVDIKPGEQVYIENAAGKTIDSFRKAVVGVPSDREPAGNVNAAKINT